MIARHTVRGGGRSAEADIKIIRGVIQTSLVGLVELLQGIPLCRIVQVDGRTYCPDNRAVVLYVVAMAAVIVGVDLVFFRNRFWERLIVNSGIVLGFAAFYLRFLRRP